MQASIQVKQDAQVQYLLRIGDTALILAQRIAEWCGHAPILEEDIALTNTALDLIGQARAVLTHAGALEGAGHDEDQLAFLREERDYRNVTLVELPRGDFAFTVVRNALMATFFRLLWEKLAASSDAELAAIAGKAVKEARYHQQHAADWLVRLAQGTDESRRRVEAALADLWRFTAELFASDAIDDQAAASALGPRWGDLQDAWRAEMNQILQEAQTALRGAKSFRIAGVISNDGETVKINLVTDGTRAKGVLTVPVKGSSVTMQIIKVGSRYYFRGRSLWLKAGGPALADRIGNRWALGNAQITLRFSIFATPAGWAKFLDPDGPITRGADVALHGKPAVTLKDDSEGLLWISAQEPHYPLRLGGGNASGSGNLNFTYNVPVQVAAPKNAVDLSRGAAGL